MMPRGPEQNIILTAATVRKMFTEIQIVIRNWKEIKYRTAKVQLSKITLFQKDWFNLADTKLSVLFRIHLLHPRVEFITSALLSDVNALESALVPNYAANKYERTSRQF